MWGIGTEMKLSNTNQRRIILEELRKLKTHPTADELYSIVRERLPQISLGTVYRNLELLSEAGEILKLELSGKQKRFDGDIRHHHHFRCKDCGKVMDVDSSKTVEVDKALDKVSREMKCQGYRLEFIGSCKDCPALN